ncbi:MAG: hypothetical protein WCJ30_23355, partial [Deltaproteobacteria bacterium]
MRRTGIRLARAALLSLFIAVVASCGGGGGWVRVPSGTTQSLDYVWGTSATDVWAVGRSGTILHYNGTAWTPSTSPTSYRLRRIAGTGPSNVWAVGDQGTVVRYDGSAWAIVPGPTQDSLQDVWCFGPRDVWVVASTRVWRWDGAAWSDQHVDGTFEYIWASGPGDIWLFQSLGDFAHWDGTQWITVPPGVSGVPLWYGVWGSGASDVWLVGSETGN